MTSGARTPDLPELIPLHRLPDLIPSSHRGKKLALATLYRWAASGRLPTVKVGGGRYVTQGDLARILSARQLSEPAPAGPTSAGKLAGAELDRLLMKRARRAPGLTPSHH